MKILFLGEPNIVNSALVKKFLKKGYDITIGSKHPDQIKSLFFNQVKTFFWQAGQPINSYYLNHVNTIFLISGNSLFESSWSVSGKQEISNSYLLPIEDIISGLKTSQTKPNLIFESSINYYHDEEGDGELQEDSSPGHDFLSSVFYKAETSINKYSKFFNRIVIVRTGVLLHSNYGLEKSLSSIIKKGFGFFFSKGNNYISTIKFGELLSLYDKLNNSEIIDGVVNAVTETLTLNDLLIKLAKRYHSKIRIRLPLFIIKLLIGDKHILYLNNKKVKPIKINLIDD